MGTIPTTASADTTLITRDINTTAATWFGTFWAVLHQVVPALPVTMRTPSYKSVQKGGTLPWGRL